MKKKLFIVFSLISLNIFGFNKKRIDFQIDSLQPVVLTIAEFTKHEVDAVVHPKILQLDRGLYFWNPKNDELDCSVEQGSKKIKFKALTGCTYLIKFNPNLCSVEQISSN